MKVSDMNQSDLKMMIRSENQKMLDKYHRKLKESFMTRSDCLKVHMKEGKPTNGNLTKEKAKFYGVLTGFIIGLSLIMGALFSFIFRN